MEPAREKDLPRGLHPGQAPRADARLPSSKSEAIRVLLCASMARGTTRLTGHLVGADTSAARAVVAALGADLQDEGQALLLSGRPPLAAQPAAPWPPSLPLGESGTLGRLAMALCALCAPATARTELVASGSLRGRPAGPLGRALTSAGAGLEYGPSGQWPRAVRACPAAPTQLRLEDPISSQEVSALLLALAALGGPRRLEVSGEIPSSPYVALTTSVLARFGARLVEERPGRWSVEGPLVAPHQTQRLEDDASAAAVLLAGACLAERELILPGLGPDSIQGDRRIVEHLTAFGCRAGLADSQNSARRGPDSPGRGARACGAPLRGADLDLSGEPDLAPVLAAVAAAAALGLAAAPAPSLLRGLGTLTIKESDRLAVLATGLRSLGLAISASGDSLSIAPGQHQGPLEAWRRGARPLTLDPHGDHRMAFAFALLGLVHPDLTVRDPNCVAKSWPDFWYQWTACSAPDYSTSPS